MAVRNRNDKGSSAKWFAIFVGVLLLLSVASYVLSISPSSQGANFRHGGKTFKQSDQGTYMVEVNGQRVDFVYRPEDLSDVVVPDSVVSKLVGSRVLIISYDWNSTLAPEMALLQLDASTLLGEEAVFVQPAYTRPNPELNWPVSACANATAFVPVLVLREDETPAVGIDSGNANCIVVGAPSQAGFWRVADALKYSLIGGNAQ